MPWRQKPKKDVARLRKATISCLASLVVDLRMGEPIYFGSYLGRKTLVVSRGTETSKYPEESKSTETPLVAASGRGSA